LLRGEESNLGKEGWHEVDVPWDDLDEGVAEPETIYDPGPDYAND